MGKAYVGLDLGTTGIKAVAFDGNNGELAQAERPTPAKRLSETRTEYDADELWATASEVLREVNAELAVLGHTTVSIAVASMAEAGVLIDDGGRPLAPVIPWFDDRTATLAERWVDVVGVERTQRIAGLTPKAVFGALKMQWTRDELPDAWAKGTCWLHLADWAAFKLCGEMATDPSLASRTMLFDVASRRWSSELIEAAGVDPSKLAQIVESGEALGTLTTEAAKVTGLPADTVVGVGGHDHVCAALALGVVEPGMLLDSIGTAEAFMLVTQAFDATGKIAAAGINQGAHVEPGRTYAMTGMLGGGRIDARRAELDLDWDEFLHTDDATKVIDEVAVDGQDRVAAMLEAAGTGDARQLITGGGSRNAKLIARKRELSAHPIDVSDQLQATALGVAMLGRRAWEGSGK